MIGGAVIDIGRALDERVIAHIQRSGFVSVRFFTDDHDSNDLVTVRIGICEYDPEVGLVRSWARHREGAAGPDKIHDLPS